MDNTDTTRARIKSILSLIGACRCESVLGIDGPWGEPECGVVGGLEGVEGGGVAEGEADVVEAVEQAIFAEWVDVEVGAEALIVGDGLGFER